MNSIVQIFKALGDETRLKILIILSRRRICAKGIAKHLNISESAVSQHLKILKEAGVIVGEKVGYYVLYKLQEAKLSEIIKFTEVLNDKRIPEIYMHKLHIPSTCNIKCKANKSKCCVRK